MDNQSPPPNYQQPQYPQQQYQPPQYPQKPGTPIWVWIIAGCLGGGVLIVVVLAALMVPVFSSARQKAQSVSCLSNMRQLGTGISMYTQDYDEVLPRKVQWIDDLQPYLKNEQICKCPVVAPRGQPSSPLFGYAYNSEMSSKKLAKIDAPAVTIGVFETGNLSRNVSDSVTTQVNPPRHNGGNNVTYVDGHARWNGSRSTGSSSGF